MAAELVAHRREQLVGEVGLAARAEALVERRGEDRRRHGFVDGGLDRPAAFAGIGDAAGEFRQCGIACRARRGQVEQPGRDHAAAAPDLGDVAQVEVVLIVLRIAQAAWSRRRRRVLLLADIGVAAGCRALRRRRP